MSTEALSPVVETTERTLHEDLTLWIYLLFFASGIPAIIYQIVWERALFSLYGINIESVTIVVSAFMLGLGLGSLAGGALSRSKRFSPLSTFAAAELGTALFGLASLNVFHLVADATLAQPLWTTGLLSFALVVVPTTLMGSTLPLFGGGVYDGRFNIDLVNDLNMIVRPFVLSAFDRTPSRVFMIGIGSGSWAQVIANNPDVHEVIIVDINPGYLEAIPRHASTASLIRNPKVTIITDDGRRWLQRHPHERFDLIVMNTTFHWRNHSSNLLSTDFLQILRSHLGSRGMVYYNTTGSDDVIATGLSVFPYGMRVYNILALSDSPLIFDRERFKSALLRYRIDGKPVVDASRPEQLQKLDFIVNTPDGPPVGKEESIEQNDEMRRWLQSRQNLIITDDNMGVEWR